jgi:uncharacterized membrane protein YeaQ/YmgE (transglycosylase-associated protein family)
MVLLVVWIALGLMAGFFASKRFHHTSRALALDVALGVGGAIAGGLVCYTLGFGQATAFEIASAVFAAIGALATLAGYRSIFRPA